MPASKANSPYHYRFRFARGAHKFPSHLKALAWIIVSVMVFHVYRNLPNWLFSAEEIIVNTRTLLAWAYFTATGMIVWLSSFWFDPWLCRRFEVSLMKRLLLGVLLLAGGFTALSYVFYYLLFPYLMGRFAYFAGLYAVIYSASMVGLLAYVWLLFSRTQSRELLLVDRLQEETAALSTNLHRIELALLDAQIEPHFLFNTLALVKRHYRHDAAAADEVMQALLYYLERATPAIRQADWTLAQELDLISSYLAILKHRFGSRLQYEIACPDELSDTVIPALVLATLVENAVRHGLTPKHEGGTIHILVRRHETSLSISICDDGVGLRHSSGSGLGLSTVRARLRTAFGEHANLVVEPRLPCGVRASLSFPLPNLPLTILAAKGAAVNSNSATYDQHAE